MKTTLKNIVIEILTIAGYEDDKEEFVNEFERLNVLEAMTHMYDTLPKEDQDKIKTYIKDPYTIKEYIPQEAYFREIIKVTRAALANLVKDMMPFLTIYQKEKINSLVVTL